MTAMLSTLSHSDDELADAVEASLKDHRVFQGDVLLGTYRRSEVGRGFGGMKLHGCDTKLMTWAHDIFREVSAHVGGGTDYKCELVFREVDREPMKAIGVWVKSTQHPDIDNCDDTHFGSTMTLAYDTYMLERR